MCPDKQNTTPGLVSVVIPVYNQQDFIEQTVQSVLNQTYKDIEVIVTDDGSVDDSQSIIKALASQHPDQVVAVFSDQNTGMAENFNRGLREVRGEFIAWLGGDDLMLPAKIEKQVALLRKREDAVGCIHDADVFVSATGESLGSFCQLYNKSKRFTEGGVELWFKASYRMLPSTVMIRSQAVPAHGFDSRLKFSIDLLFDVEVFRHGRCVVINQVLGRYRRHEKNVTSSVELRSTVVEEILLALSIIEARYPELYSLIKKRRRGLFIKEAVIQYRQDRALALSYAKIAIREGALLSGTMVYFALLLFGDLVTSMVQPNRYENKEWVIRLMKWLNHE